MSHLPERAAVVGAGIVGRLAALHLARRGVRVTLYDRGDLVAPKACSFAAAGLLAPVAEAVAAADPRLYGIGLASRGLWQGLSASLGLPALPQSTAGSLAVATTSDLVELDEFQDKIARFAPKAVVQELDAAALGRLEPCFAGSAFRGLWTKDEGHVDARAALDVLRRALQDSSLVTMRLDAPVREVLPFFVDDEAFDLVVDARGLGAKADLPGLRGVRGEILEVHAPEVNLTRPVRVLHQRYPVYVVPRGKDRYAIGATSIESESLAPVSVKATLDLLGAAYALHPGFRYAAVTESFAQARPAFDDHWPRVLAREGLVQVNGLYRHGFLLSPLVVEAMMRLIVNGIETETGPARHLAELLEVLGYAPDGVAVALNKDFVPRRSLSETPVKDGDQVEVLAPMAGG